MSGFLKRLLPVISIVALLLVLAFLQCTPQRIAQTARFSIGWPFPFLEFWSNDGVNMREIFHSNGLLADLSTMAVVLTGLVLGFCYVRHQRTIQISDFLAVMFSLALAIVAYQSATGIEIGFRRAIGSIPRGSNSMSLSIISLAALFLFSYTVSSVAFRMFGSRQGEASG